MPSQKPFDRKTVGAPAEQKAEVRVFKFEEDVVETNEVKSFEFSKITRPGEGDYQALKSRFGALAATDTDKRARNKKDERFELNPVLRGRLAIEEEERRAIQARVDARVQEEIAAMREEERKRGYAEGLEQGKGEAFAKFKEEGQERITRLEALIAEMEKAKEQVYQANERFLMEMVFRISRMILLRELKADHEQVLRLAKLLVERVGVRENIKIKINPEEKTSMGMLKESLEQSFGGLKNLSIEPSSRVQGGGCMIETDWNMIDASLDTQLAGVHEALFGSAADPNSNSDSKPDSQPPTPNSDSSSGDAPQ